MRQGSLTPAELDAVAAEAEDEAKESRKKGWEMFQNPIKIERDALVRIINERSCRCTESEKEAAVDDITGDLMKIISPIRKDNFMAARKILRNICKDCLSSDNLKEELQGWLKRNYQDANKSYNSFLYNEMPSSVLNVKPVPPKYSENFS